MRSLISMAILLMFMHTTHSQIHKLPSHFDWQGHRGARGLMPENTLPAFIEALRYPVTTLELDVVVSLDGRIIVSHEPWLHPQICLDAQGNPIPEGPGMLQNLYLMTAEEIRRCDCGTPVHPEFPRQQRIAAYKPALSEVVNAVKIHCAANDREMPAWSIELKSRESWYYDFVPPPKEFVKAVLKEIEQLGIRDKTILQSFDPNVLREILRQSRGTVRIAYLVGNIESAEFAIEQLGFVPHYYSPHYLLVSEETISYAHAAGMKVVPWTVNSIEEFDRLIGLGVDGIITDYPDLIGEYLNAR